MFRLLARLVIAVPLRLFVELPVRAAALVVRGAGLFVKLAVLPVRVALLPVKVLA